MNNSDFKKYVEKRLENLKKAKNKSIEPIPKTYYAGEIFAYEDILQILEEK